MYIVQCSSTWSGRKKHHLYTAFLICHFFITRYTVIPDKYLITHNKFFYNLHGQEPRCARKCNINSSILLFYHRHKSLVNWILTFGHQPLISCFIDQETVAFVLGFLIVMYLSDSIIVTQTHLLLKIFPYQVRFEEIKGILSVKCPSPHCVL